MGVTFRFKQDGAFFLKQVAFVPGQVQPPIATRGNLHTWAGVVS
jgi:hypothetical protein